MRIYGLTGGTGSGKSEAGRRFAELGIPVLDADAIGHEVIAPGGPAEAAVREVFGEEILSEGRIDRAKLGTRVFSDSAARQRLNAIVHPAIRLEIATRCAALAQAGHPIAIIDAALLAENGAKEPFLDGLIVVTCAEETRARRLIERCGLDAEEVRRRIAAQAPPERKVAIADWVIDNNGSIEALRARVDEIARELRRNEPKTD